MPLLPAEEEGLPLDTLESEIRVVIPGAKSKSLISTRSFFASTVRLLPAMVELLPTAEITLFWP